MNLCAALALDTSSAVTFVAVRSSAGDVFERASSEAANHSEQLANLVAAALNDASLGVKDLQQLIVGQGPGSFTGLRIGFSFMKGLASSIAVPLVAVSSLAAAAFEFLEPGRLVASIADARRDQLFCQMLCMSQAGDIEPAEPAAIIEVADLWPATHSALLQKGFSSKPLAVCVDSSLSFLKEGNFASPKNVGRSLLELAGVPGFVSDSVLGGIFDARAVANLEPNYVRAVAAKTIEQRSL